MASPKKRARKTTRKKSASTGGSRLKPFFIGALFGLLVAVAGYLVLTRDENSLNLFPKQSGQQESSPRPPAPQPKPAAPSTKTPAPSAPQGTQTPTAPSPARSSQPAPAQNQPAESSKTQSKPSAPAASKNKPDTKSQAGSNSQQDEIGQFLNKKSGSDSKQQKLPANSKSQSSKDDLGDLIGFVSTDNSNNSATSSNKQPAAKTGKASKSTNADAANPKFLQAGVFQSTQEAENFRAKLLMDGFDPVQIQSTTLKGKSASKVLIGPFTSQVSLEDATARLKKNNIRFQVISR